MREKSEQFKGWIEGKARALREKCGVTPFARLDPFELARKMQILVVPPSHFSDVTVEMLHKVTVKFKDAWDAGTLPLPDGTHLVVLNPAREHLRKHTSVMEELAHIYLDHKPSQLVDIGGIVLRSWNSSNEKQAYAVGSAALLPEYLLKGARTRGYTAEQVSEQHQVSRELVAFRLNVTRIALPKESLAVC